MKICVFKEYLRATRVESWFSWVFNFGFGATLFGQPPLTHGYVVKVILLSFAFILNTASIFVLNQYFDRETDRWNEIKRELPIASGKIKPQHALIFAISLSFLGLILVLITDAILFPLFLAHLGLCTAYSVPPLHFKGVPLLDFIVAGVSSGLLPFIMGLQASHQLTSDLSLPWIRRRYYDAVLSAIPLLLIHSGTHILQTVGDFEADRQTGVQTSAVRYGKRKSILMAKFMFLMAAFSPIVYSTLGLFSTVYLPWLLVIYLFSVPIVIYFLNVLRDPSEERILGLQRMAKKYGPPIMAIMWIYLFVLRMILPKI